MGFFSRAPQRLSPASPSRPARAIRLSPSAHPAIPFLPYLVLLRVGFAMPRALLRGRCALTAPFHPYRNSRTSQAPRLAPALPSRPAQSGSAFAGHLPAAVCFLWYFPSIGLEPNVPDVIRHTALWSSDFPLSKPRSPGKSPAFTARQRPSGPTSAIHIIRWIQIDFDSRWLQTAAYFIPNSYVVPGNPVFQEEI